MCVARSLPCCDLLQVAEATVLHNEAQLQESVEARCTAEEQVCQGLLQHARCMFATEPCPAFLHGCVDDVFLYVRRYMRCGWSWRRSACWWGSWRQS